MDLHMQHLNEMDLISDMDDGKLVDLEKWKRLCSAKPVRLKTNRLTSIAYFHA
jgi:hypothetical protein